MKPSIYLDACPLIDMAESKAGKIQASDARAVGVWFCQQALRAARAGKISAYTSIISVAECTSVGPEMPSPPEEVKRFYEMLLLSGKSGVQLIQTTQSISTKARDLRWVSSINLKGMDAIHVASAMFLKCNEVWTRDGRIWKNKDKLRELGISVVRPADTVVLPSEFREMDFGEEFLANPN